MKSNVVIKTTLILLLALATTAHASGVGDLCVHISNDMNAIDTVVVGRTNTLEIWIANDDLLGGFNPYLQILFPDSLIWQMDGDVPAVVQHGRALGNAADGSCWSLTGLQVGGSFDFVSPEELIFGGAAIPPGGLVAGPSELCYSFEITIPEIVQPPPYAFCVTLTTLPPAGEYPFADNSGNYPPTFCGLDFGATICYDIAEIPWIDGDANRDGTVNIGDAVYILQYIFAAGPPPYPYLAGDPSCDGIVNITDAVYLTWFIFQGGPWPDCY